MRMKKRNWMAIILCLLLALAGGLLSACGSGDDPEADAGDLEDFPEEEAVSLTEARIVMQIGFDFGKDANGFVRSYESELLDFALEIGEEQFYRFQIILDDAPLYPHVLIRHKDGHLYTYYEEDGTMLDLEALEDPVLGPYVSADILPSDDDAGHGLPGAVDVDLDNIYDQIYSNDYDGYYEGGFEGTTGAENQPVVNGDPASDDVGDPENWEEEPENFVPDGAEEPAAE